jgi:hypothetical protein
VPAGFCIAAWIFCIYRLARWLAAM